ncbi:Amidase enhancer precursor [compost metagenome]
MAVRTWFLAVLLALFGAFGSASPSHAQDQVVVVRVLERWVGSAAEIRSNEPATLPGGRTQQGNLKLEARGNQLRLNGKIVLGAELQVGRSVETSQFEVLWPGGKRKYPGGLRVRVESGKLVLLNEVPLESYVAGVVSGEMPENWPLPALRAQAVLARTLALRGGDHAKYALCDLTHCQVYAGERRPEAVHVALETRGHVLTYRGSLIQPLFHSTCGGERVSNATIFGGAPLPYLQEGLDPYCADSPHAARWTVRVLESELSRALGLPRVEAVQVLSRSEGGWVAQLSVDGRQMTGYRFWQAVGRELGWGMLKSMRFAVRREGNAYVFEGQGLGHGVGLCQWGAKGQAERGIPYARILASYFPGTAIARR